MGKTAAIKLDDMPLPPVLERASEELSMAMDHIFYRGGVLRDTMRGQPHNDIDGIILPKTQTRLWQAVTQRAADLPEQGLYYYSPSLDEVVKGETGCSLKAIFAQSDKIILWLKFQGVSRGEELDLTYLRDAPKSIKEVSEMSEAPISSLVLDDSEELWGHPRALKDMYAGKFRQFLDMGLHQQCRTLYRWAKIQAAHPDFKYRPNAITALPYIFWKATDTIGARFGNKEPIKNMALERWRRSQMVHKLSK